jgi:Lectin C-type domain/FG-GAP-like repeat/RTX calcium-binding nonapeptide repeat (4 copies)
MEREMTTTNIKNVIGYDAPTTPVSRLLDRYPDAIASVKLTASDAKKVVVSVGFIQKIATGTFKFAAFGNGELLQTGFKNGNYGFSFSAALPKLPALVQSGADPAAQLSGKFAVEQKNSQISKITGGLSLTYGTSGKNQSVVNINYDSSQAKNGTAGFFGTTAKKRGASAQLELLGGNLVFDGSFTTTNSVLQGNGGWFGSGVFASPMTEAATVAAALSGKGPGTGGYVERSIAGTTEARIPITPDLKLFVSIAGQVGAKFTDDKSSEITISVGSYTATAKDAAGLADVVKPLAIKIKNDLLTILRSDEKARAADDALDYIGAVRDLAVYTKRQQNDPSVFNSGDLSLARTRVASLKENILAKWGNKYFKSVNGQLQVSKELLFINGVRESQAKALGIGSYVPKTSNRSSSDDDQLIVADLDFSARTLETLVGTGWSVDEFIQFNKYRREQIKKDNNISEGDLIKGFAIELAIAKNSPSGTDASPLTFVDAPASGVEIIAESVADLRSSNSSPVSAEDIEKESSSDLGISALKTMSKYGWSSEQYTNYLSYRDYQRQSDPTLDDVGILNGYRIRLAIAKNDAAKSDTASVSQNQSDRTLVDALAVANVVGNIVGGKTANVINLVSSVVSAATAPNLGSQAISIGSAVSSFGSLIGNQSLNLTGNIIASAASAASATTGGDQWAGIGSAVASFGGLIGSKPIQVTGQLVNAVASGFQVADQLRNIGASQANAGAAGNASYAISHASTAGWVQGIGAVAGVASGLIGGTAGQILGGVSNVANTFVNSTVQVALGNVSQSAASAANWTSIGTTALGIIIGGEAGKWISNIGSIAVPLLLSNPVGAVIAVASIVFGWLTSLFGSRDRTVYTYDQTDAAGRAYHVERTLFNKIKMAYQTNGAYWDAINNVWTASTTTLYDRPVAPGGKMAPTNFADGDKRRLTSLEMNRIKRGEEGLYVQLTANNTWYAHGSAPKNLYADFAADYQKGQEYQDRLIDIDGDGDLDLIWRDAGQVRYFRNDGVNGFAGTNGPNRVYPDGRNWDYQVGVATSSLGGIIAAYRPGQDSYGDVNRDGAVDIIFSGDGVVSAGGNGFQWVLFGNGQGNFAGPRTFSYLDVNSDGHADLVLDGGGIVQLNNGANYFGGAIGTGVDWNNMGSVRGLWNAFAKTDVNGDGIADAVVQNWTNNGASSLIAILQPDGSYFYSDVAGWSGMNITQQLGENVKADVNGDGRADSIWRSGSNRIYVALNNGAGGYGNNYEAANGSGIVGGTFASGQASYLDVNLDGKIDIVWAGQYLQLGQANGSFGGMINTGIDWSNPAALRGLWDNFANYDVNGDGILDAVAQNWTNNGTTRLIAIRQPDGGIFFSNATGWTGMTVAQMAGDTVKADVNGDDRADVIWRSGDNRLFVALDNGAGAYTSSFWAADGAGLVGGTYAAGQASYLDVNVDGKIDVVWGGRYIQLGQSDGHFAAAFDTWIDWNTSGIFNLFANYDVNGDGTLDAVVQNWTDGGATHFVAIRQPNGAVFYGNASGWTGMSMTQMVGETVKIDVNGDGLQDAVWRSGDNRVFVSTKHSNGSFNNAVQAADGAGWVGATYAAGQVSFGDVNFDGKTDLIWANRYIQLGQGNATFGAAIDTSLDWNATNLRDQFAYYDVNGDGRKDAILENWTNTNQRLVALRLADGSFVNVTGWLSNAVAEQIGKQLDTDVNGDGIKDAAWTAVDGIAYVAFGRANGQFGDVHNFGASGAPANIKAIYQAESNTYTMGQDLNADGRDDVVMNLGEGRTQFWLTNADGSLVAAPMAKLANVWTAGEAFLGDINGDGLQDSIFRDTNSTLWIGLGQQGTNVKSALTAQNIAGWGGIAANFTTKNVAIADVDADGKDDLVWWDNVSGKIYLSKGQANGTFEQPTLTAPLATWTGGDYNFISVGDADGDAKADLLLSRATQSGNKLTSEWKLLEAQNGGLVDSGTGSSTQTFSDYQGNVVKNSANGHYYLVSSTAMTWEQAQAWARKNGGDLVTVNNEAEQTWLRSSFDSTNDYWLGLNDAAQEGQWVWSSGEVSSYTKWAANEPNNAGTGEDYAHLAQGAQGQWNDIAGDTLFYGIAEIAPERLTTIATVLPAELRDVDGDGKSDLVRATMNGAGLIQHATVQFGQTIGGFESAVLTILPTVDINDDGVADQVFVRASDATLWGALGKSGSSFSARTQIGSKPVANWSAADTQVIVGDVNGDGRADQVWINRTTGDYQLYTNTTATTAGSVTQSGKLTAASVYALIDVNGDGRSELVTSAPDGNLKASFFTANGSTDFTLASTANQHGMQSLGQSVQVDVNGDGINDSLLLSTPINGVTTWARVAYGRSDGSYGALTLLASDLGYAPTALVGDITGDGKADLVWVETTGWNRGADGLVWIAKGINQNWTVNQNLGWGGSGTYSLVDIDGDGINELVQKRSDGSMNAAFFTTDGTIARTIQSFAKDGVQTLGMTNKVDINGDGFLDLVFDPMDKGGAGVAPAAATFGTRVALGQANGKYGAWINPLTNIGGTGWTNWSWYNDSDVLYGDVNGDGRADLVLNYTGSGNNLHVALGQTDGKFSTWQLSNYALGWGARGNVTLSDINQDGVKELVQTNTDGSMKAAFFNSTGTAVTTIQSVALNGSQTLGDTYIGDINGDGLDDSVLRDTKGTLHIALGKSNGTFAAVKTVDLRDWGSNDWAYSGFQVAAGDANGDGRMDLAWRFSDGRFWLSLGQVNGSFTTPGADIGSIPFAAAGTLNLIDLDGDGRAEAVYQQTKGTLKALFFNTDGSISATVNSANVNGKQTLGQAVTADINGDGIADKIFNQVVTGAITDTNNGTRISLGKADGSFSAAVTSTSWAADSAMYYADINGDGKADLVMDYQKTGNKFYAALGKGDGTFGAWTLSATNPGWGTAGTYSLTDVNGDGRAELLFVGNDGTAKASFFNTNGTIFTSITSAAKNGTQTLGQMSKADINGDGVIDSIFNLPVTANQTNGSLIALGKADGSFNALTWSGGTYGNSTVIYGDVTGDGKADMVVLYENDPSKLYVEQYSVAGVLIKDTASESLGWSKTAVGAYSLADINGDGRDELVFKASDGSMKAAFFKADGIILTTINSALKDGKQSLGQATQADVNGDGVLDSVFDLVVGNNEVDGTFIALGKVDGTFDAITKSGGTYGNSTTLYGDITGDGKAERINLYLNNASKLYVGNYSNGKFTDIAKQDLGWTGTGQYDLSDLNGDGRDELVFQKSDGTMQAAFFNANGTVASTLSSVANSEGIQSLGVALSADVNGDGQIDAIFRGADNSMRVAMGNNTNASSFNDIATVASAIPAASAWGTGSAAYTVNYNDAVQFADVNGDGKDDLVWAVTDGKGDANGKVLILQSSSNATSASFSVAGGVNSGSGIVSLTDIDGDGRVDLIRTTRDSNGKVTARQVWFGQSTGGFTSAAVSGIVKNGDIVLGEQEHADLNGDGQLDVIYRSTDNRIRYALGDNTKVNGYGNWVTLNATVSDAYFGALGSQKTSYTFNDALAFGDTDGDGKDDLIWVKADANGVLNGKVSVIKSTGNATANLFANDKAITSQLAKVETNSGVVSLADVNGDGRIDVLRTTMNSKGVATARHVEFGTPTGNITLGFNGVSKNGDISLGEQYQADINGDGQLDIIFRGADNSVRIALGDATKPTGYGTMSLGITSAIPAPSAWGTGSDSYAVTYQDALQVTDVNGDGKADLVWARVDSKGDATGGIVVMRSSGTDSTPAFTATGQRNSTAGTASLMDVDGDLRTDLIRTTVDDAGSITAQQIYFGQSGNTSFSTTAVNAQTDGETLNIGEQFYVDLNNDKVMDNVYRTPGNTLRYALGQLNVTTQNINFGSWTTLANVVPSGLGLDDVLQVVDADNDGKADLYWADATTGAVTLMRNTGNATTPSFTAVDLNGTAAGVADIASGTAMLTDVNGDGKIDLVRKGEGSSGNTVRLGNASGALDAAIALYTKVAVPTTLDSNVNLNGLANTLATIQGDNRDQSLFGTDWADQINGGAGNDVLKGNGGSDNLTDTAGNDSLFGGAGNDILSSGDNNSILAGGTGNDLLQTGAGLDIIAFNKGDGIDTVVTTDASSDNELSLGGGILYSDIQLAKVGNNLELRTSSTDTVVLKDWYANTSNHSIGTLQVAIKGGDYNASSTDKTKNKTVQEFNFIGLVGKFDAARQATPNLSSWAVSSALTDFYLSSSNNAGYGGDIVDAYHQNTLSGLGNVAANSVLASADFGKLQAFQGFSERTNGAFRLA